MGFNVGGIVNSIANISSKGEGSQNGESSLHSFLNAMTKRGVQIKSNFEVEFLQFSNFQFFCQSVTIPGLRGNTASLNYKGRSIQVPVTCEQEHEFQFTVINDASGKLYRQMRELMIFDYSYHMLDNGYTVTVKQRGDGQNYAGENIIMRGVRLNGISGLDFGALDNTVQTFTVDGYVNFVDFRPGKIDKKDGLLGSVDKISGKISEVLGG